jgi:hypothetical protein
MRWLTQMLPPRLIGHSIHASRRVVLQIGHRRFKDYLSTRRQFPLRTAKRELILVEMALEQVDRIVEKVRAWSRGGVSQHIRGNIIA